MVAADPVFSKADRHFLNHTSMYERVMAKSARINQRIKELQLNAQEAAWFKLEVDEAMPLTLHEVAFIPCLQYQCTPEQQSWWLQKALDLEIIGCYAQTERTREKKKKKEEKKGKKEKKRARSCNILFFSFLPFFLLSLR
jgi:acyl-CoA oxidase